MILHVYEAKITYLVIEMEYPKLESLTGNFKLIPFSRQEGIAQIFCSAHSDLRKFAPDAKNQMAMSKV